MQGNSGTCTRVYEYMAEYMYVCTYFRFLTYAGLRSFHKFSATSRRVATRQKRRITLFHRAVQCFLVAFSLTSIMDGSFSLFFLWDPWSLVNRNIITVNISYFELFVIIVTSCKKVSLIHGIHMVSCVTSEMSFILVPAFLSIDYCEISERGRETKPGIGTLFHWSYSMIRRECICDDDNKECASHCIHPAWCNEPPFRTHPRSSLISLSILEDLTTINPVCRDLSPTTRTSARSRSPRSCKEAARNTVASPIDTSVSLQVVNETRSVLRSRCVISLHCRVWLLSLSLSLPQLIISGQHEESNGRTVWDV